MFDLAIADQVARLTLDRREARNAIPTAGWAVLAERGEAAAAAGARILLILGEGPAFCAGADVSEFAAFHRDVGAASHFQGAIENGLGRLRALPIPTLAIIDGPCFGAGVALAMACDIRVAGPRARFAITPAKIGISYPQPDVHRLVSLVGPGQAARLLFGAATIDGAEAARIGLVEHQVEQDIDAAVDTLVAAILANSGDSLATLKRGIALAAAGVAVDEAQAERFDALLAGDGAEARLAAIREARLA